VDEPSFPRDVVFDLPAESDYLDALRYYEDEAGLGAVFEAEIKAGVAWIVEHPEACPVVTREGARRKVLAKFPYNLYYSVEPSLIRIRAVAHQSRRPGYWIER
jgi:toxin ParE1/3/4